MWGRPTGVGPQRKQHAVQHTWARSSAAGGAAAAASGMSASFASAASTAFAAATLEGPPTAREAFFMARRRREGGWVRVAGLAGDSVAPPFPSQAVGKRAPQGSRSERIRICGCEPMRGVIVRQEVRTGREEEGSAVH